jgi:hypothetical protein
MREVRKPRGIGELRDNPNENMKQKYAAEYEFNKKELEHVEEQNKTGEENKPSEKPKYDKNADFFDNITNSTLEEKKPFRGGRGGYRGGFRGRGGYDN